MVWAAASPKQLNMIISLVQHDLVTAHPLSSGIKINPWFRLSFCSEPTPRFLLYPPLHWMPKKSQCTWHEGCTSYIYAPTNVCSILVLPSLKSSKGRRHKVQNSPCNCFTNTKHWSPTLPFHHHFSVHFLLKFTQNINPEGTMVISVQQTVVSGLLLHLKLPENKPLLFLIVLP